MKRFVTAAALMLATIVPVLAEQLPQLDGGIAEAAQGILSRLPGGTKVAIIDIRSDRPEASEYIIDQLTYELVQAGKLTVIDRGGLDRIRNELSFQMSGEVSDESAQRVGALLGAEVLITGSFDFLADRYRLSVKTVRVETAEILYLGNIQIAGGEQADSLTGRHSVASIAVASVGKAAHSVADFTGRFFCSTINPVFGLGSYIQGDFSGGRKVTFWEMAGIVGIWYGAYRNDNGLENGGLFMGAGGIAAGGAVVYSLIRPWTFNRAPKVAAVLDNMHLSIRTSSGVSVGYTFRY